VDLRRSIRKRRKDSRWIVAGLAVLLLVLVLVYSLFLRGRDLPEELVDNQLLLFVLWYINVVLILAIGFTLIRNLFKLALERRNRLLGSKFKTKLVLTYIGLSLIPVILLFAYGSRLLQGWMDRWFDETAIRRVADHGFVVAQELHRRVEEDLERDARQLLDALATVDFDNPRRGPQLDRILRHQLLQLDLAFVSVYEGTDFLHGVLSPQAGLRDLPNPGRRFLVDSLQSGSATRRLADTPDGAARLVMAGVAARAGAPKRPVVVVGEVLDSAVASRAAELIQTRQRLAGLDARRDDIQAGFFLLFLMVTLIILLAVTWVGLYLARRVTQPIEALAEGTRRVAEGDLDYRVEAPADDELRVLVDSFNTMTGDLARKESQLEESHRALLATNERLGEERALLAAVLQSSAAGVISVDPHGRVLTCNGTALQMLRQADGELVGRTIYETWSDGERGKLAELFAAPASSGRLVRTVRLVLGGEWRTLEARVTTMRTRDGEVAGRVMVVDDLTDLINAQQMAAWNEAARRVAHEIKNPLTPIKLTAERLLRKHRQRDADLGRALEEGVEIIVREVAAMQAMVDEFSRFARMPRPQPSEVDMPRLLRETLHLYEEIKSGVAVAGSVTDEAARAWLDGEQIKRVLINLLDNAVAAVEPPGEVEVTVDCDNGHLRIRIADTGTGIPPDARAKLFLPYFSTKGRGTGLGLSIVHRIVTEHHGTVRVEENRPQGTIFTVELPQG
jgi:two-component system nitrogen regulation sensor histidine kinase NtrY